jgi:hypothetical protein
LTVETAKSKKTAYHDFLVLWKDADPDIPILIVTQSDRFLAGREERFPQQAPLKQAKVEYALAA